MPRMSDAELQAHNDRVDDERRARYDQETYMRSMTPEQMVQSMELNPSYEDYVTFSEVFGEIMDAQITLRAADDVHEDWLRMTGAYEKFAKGQ